MNNFIAFAIDDARDGNPITVVDKLSNAAAVIGFEQMAFKVVAMRNLLCALLFTDKVAPFVIAEGRDGAVRVSTANQPPLRIIFVARHPFGRFNRYPISSP